MTRPGYQEGSEPMLWWKVARHLDAAQLALANAMAHNVDDPRPMQALYDRLREGQAILLEIFHAKGLLPGSSNGKAAAPPPGMPTGMPMPPEMSMLPGPSGMPMPGMPMAMPVPVMPMPMVVGEPAVPASEEQPPSFVAEEPAVLEADRAAVEIAAEPVGEMPAAPIASEAAAPAPPADSNTGGAVG